MNQGESGITYDGQTYMIHTKITDNGDGTLKAEHQVLAGIGEDDQMIPAEENAITFQNSYKAEPAIRFENLAFDSEGTYEYTISEVNDKQTGVTYDENVYKLTVSVTDDGSGVLSAKVSGDKATFTNNYKATDPKTDPKSDTKSKTPASDAKDKVPETGDSSSIALYLVLAVIAAMSGALVVRRKNK